MNRKQYLTSLFNKFRDDNLQALERYYSEHSDYIYDIVLIFPYMIAANFYYVPGFKKDLPSLSVFHFRMSEHLKHKLAVYLNVKDIKNISSSIDSDIISVYLYDDTTIESDVNFLVFYNEENITVSKLEYLKEKVERLENWFKNRFKVTVYINLFSDRNRTLFHLKNDILVSIFDFYCNSIHLEGKYTYRFLLNKKITPVEFLEDKRDILMHNWLNESLFFSLPHFRPSKEDLKKLIKFYLGKTLDIEFQNFHKLLFYHSLYNSKNTADYFKIFNESKFYDELGTIKKESGFEFKSVAFLEYMILLKDRKINPFRKDKLKSRFMLFESLNIKDDSENSELEILRANFELIKLLNLMFSIYKDEDNPVYRLLKTFNGSISYHNFLNYSFSSDKLIIMNTENTWGLYLIEHEGIYQKYKKLYDRKSLIELLIFSIYNKYIVNSIPTIKNKSNNILDENNYFNRLKNKLIKYDISFDALKYMENIDNYDEEIDGIFIFLNFSLNIKTKNIKDYTYVSEQWDPLNYGYNKKSNIRDIALIVKTNSQKVFYYEYYSDEAVLMAIQNLFSRTFKYNENLEITVNIFDSVLSASVIFRLKKLIKTAYEIFSYKDSMLLTSYNGTISLLKKKDGSIDILPYENKWDFFNMLAKENSLMEYKIDEDVLELRHFSKIVESSKKDFIDMFFMVTKNGNIVYIFDENNLFYYFENISLKFLANIAELALNHLKHIETVKKINLFNVEEKELNEYELIPISIENLIKINPIDKKFALMAEGSVNKGEFNLSYKINNEVFSYKKLKDKAFFKMIKFVKLSNVDKIKITALHTSYFSDGKRYYSFKYKLKVFELLNDKLKKTKESI